MAVKEARVKVSHVLDGFEKQVSGASCTHIRIVVTSNGGTIYNITLINQLNGTHVS